MAARITRTLSRLNKMQIKYSIRGLLVLTTLAGIVTFLQLGVNRNIAMIKNEISEAPSPFDTDGVAQTPYTAVPTYATEVGTEVLITGTDVEPTLFDLLLFRRTLKIDYEIQAIKTTHVPSHYKTRLKTGKDFNVQYYRFTFPRAVTAHVGPFGYTID